MYEPTIFQTNINWATKTNSHSPTALHPLITSASEEALKILDPALAAAEPGAGNFASLVHGD